MTTITTTKKGKAAETAAEKFLIKKGLIPIDKNYSLKMGEIDLIMKDHDTYVFIEVRSRKESYPYHPLESITRKKQQNIIRTATYYLLEKNLWNKVHCRFDVVAILNENGMMNFDWIVDAFC